MSRFKIINLFDKIFITISTFLIIYAWLNFYLRDLWTSFILGLIFSFAILFLLFYFINKQKIKKLTTKKEAEEIETNFFVFKLNSKQKKYEILRDILSLEYEVKLTNKMLTYEKNNKKHLVIIATHLDEINTNTLINLVDEFSKIQVDVINIICNSVSNSINKNLFLNKEIEFITKENLYFDYFKKSNIFPDRTNINLKINKPTFKNILKNFFTPEKAKSYFLCGFILIFSSIILPFHLYYLIFGSVLLIFAISCKILGKLRNK